MCLSVNIQLIIPNFLFTKTIPNEIIFLHTDIINPLEC
jgi:hypothetical protein